jgi:2-polyprenyl-6-methoxyphenol hydroxylase-like FAD-dependent oxidoreductase
MPLHTITPSPAGQRDAHAAQRTAPGAIETGCCIVGGGPAGAVLALLLARQGIDVTLLESHADFDRDFRGDTLHASTLELMDQLGLADRLLQLPHTIERQRLIHGPAGPVPTGDLTRLKTKYPYLVLLPQVRLLEFVVAEAQRYPPFHLLMGARVEALIEHDGAIRGVRFRRPDGWQEVHAQLTVGADGRFSRIRQLAGFQTVGKAQPMDVLQFRLPRRPDDGQKAGGIYLCSGNYMVLVDRGEFWLIAYLFPKGGYQRLRGAGLQAVRQAIAERVPWLAERTVYLQDWSQTSVLSIESSHVRRWFRRGLLVIGDAAHVMSPTGGVGVNFAIQDAVVTANVLGPRLKRGDVRERDLAAVQRKREWPTRLTQRFQALAQQQTLADASAGARAPLAAQFVQRMPFLRELRTRLFAFGGFRPARVQS